MLLLWRGSTLFIGALTALLGGAPAFAGNVTLTIHPNYGGVDDSPLRRDGSNDEFHFEGFDDLSTFPVGLADGQFDGFTVQTGYYSSEIVDQVYIGGGTPVGGHSVLAGGSWLSPTKQHWNFLAQREFWTGLDFHFDANDFGLYPSRIGFALTGARPGLEIEFLLYGTNGEVLYSVSEKAQQLLFSEGSRRLAELANDSGISRIHIRATNVENDAIFHVDDVQFTSHVPEPPTGFLAGTGLLAFLAFRRRRRQLRIWRRSTLYSCALTALLGGAPAFAGNVQVSVLRDYHSAQDAPYTAPYFEDFEDGILDLEGVQIIEAGPDLPGYTPRVLTSAEGARAVEIGGNSFSPAWEVILPVAPEELHQSKLHFLFEDSVPDVLRTYFGFALIAIPSNALFAINVYGMDGARMLRFEESFDDLDGTPFFAVTSDAPIRSIEAWSYTSGSTSFFQLDHVQYGVPEPAAITISTIGLAALMLVHYCVCWGD